MFKRQFDFRNKIKVNILCIIFIFPKITHMWTRYVYTSVYRNKGLIK